MRLATRLVRRKSFVQPPFWTNDSFGWGNALPTKEQIGDDFESYINGVYKANGVVFACMLARAMMFSEVRFAFQRMREGRPADVFGSRDLGALERPWPGGTTGELLIRMLQDADLAGNSFWTWADDEGRVGRLAKTVAHESLRLTRLRPDWMSIILGSKSGNLYAADTRVIAYRYAPPQNGEHGGPDSEVLLLPSETAHFSPLPDPAARFRGMSWLTPTINEIKADKAASKHKLKFFDQGATLSTIIRLAPEVTPAAFEEFVAKFKAQHEGVDTAYKTLFVGGGADATINQANMREISFKETQGAGETRIAAAAGIHPVVVGLSEGLQGSALNAGNFGSAVKFTVHKTIRPLWRMAAASLETLVPAPGDDARLWYDDRDVAFLQEDSTDLAEIQSKQAVTARQLTDAGYTPDSVVAYLRTGNLDELEHSGLFSVQLQAPGTTPALPSPEGDS